MNEQLRQEIAELTESYLDGTADRDTRHRLTVLLRESLEAREFYVEYCQTHSMLAWEHGSLPPVVFPEALSPGSSSNRATLYSRAVERWRLMSLAASVMFLVSTSWLILLWMTPAAPVNPAADAKVPLEYAAKPSPAGVVLASSSPVWEEPGTPTAPGEVIMGGTLNLRSGWVQIALFGGATVTLRGPCQFDLESRERAWLHRGDILVSIRSDRASLTLNTPVGELLHLGTEFGVSVRDGGDTEMYVFNGAVEVKATGGSPAAGSARILQSGTAMRLEPSGRVEYLGREQSETFRSIHEIGASTSGFRPGPLTVAPPGFEVRYAKADVARLKINTLAAAERLLDGPAGGVTLQDATAARVRHIDFEDYPEEEQSTYLEVFPGGSAYPGDDDQGRLVDDDGFVIRATALIDVRDAWQYSFLVNADDGARLRIDGRDVIVDDGIHPPQVSIGTVLLTPGLHALELVAYEDAGFARVELGYARGDTRKLEEFQILATSPESGGAMKRGEW